MCINLNQKISQQHISIWECWLDISRTWTGTKTATKAGAEEQKEPFSYTVTKYVYIRTYEDTLLLSSGKLNGVY